MTLKIHSYESRIAAEQEELEFQHRVAVEALERLRDYNHNRDSRFDDELDWTPIAERVGQLRTLANEITGADRHRESRAA